MNDLFVVCVVNGGNNAAHDSLWPMSETGKHRAHRPDSIHPGRFDGLPEYDYFKT